MKPLFLPLAALLLSLNASNLMAADNLLREMSSDRGDTVWKLELLEDASGTLKLDEESGKPVIEVEVPAATELPYHVNMFQAGLKLDESKTYKLSFRAKASEEVTTSVNAMIMEDPWVQVWNVDLPLTKDWEEYEFTFSPKESTEIGRITFGRLGKQAGTYWFSDIVLTEAP